MYTYERKVGNTYQPFRLVPVYSDGTTPDLTGATVRFVMTPRGSLTAKVDAAATIVSGAFQYAPTSGDVDTAGLYDVVWRVTRAGKPETWPSRGYYSCLLERDL